jgi:hypothetical protein
VTSALCAAIQAGKQARAIQNEGKDQEGGEPQRKRSSRVQFRANGDAAAEAEAIEKAAEPAAAAEPSEG